MPLSTGSRLGPYEVVSPLGAGGMGEVYRARDARLGRDVAVKVLPTDRAADPERLRRFGQEARALAALNHANILAIHDIGSEGGVSYVVFELLEGQTLGHRLQHGPVPIRKAIDYGIQICHGLAAAHSHGVVHRDLKPDNLFLTADGRMKILDFGLAKLIDASYGAGVNKGEAGTATDPGVLLGTVDYMSPEQARGRSADPRSDVFSLGAILYEMLSGRKAFAGETVADTLSAILHRDPPEINVSSEPLPLGLDRVVRHCLEKDPEERFQSARDVAFGLETLSASSQAGPLPESTAWSRRRWLGVGTGSLVLLAGIAAAFAWGTHRATTRLPIYRQLTFQRGMVLDARFTADGNTVVYSALWDGNPAETFSMRPERPESLSLGLPPARLYGVSRQGELAILLGKPGERRFAWNGTLARVPLSGGAPREIFEDVWSADWSPDGHDLAVIRRVEGEYQLEYPIGRVLIRPLPGVVNSGFAFRVSPRGDKVAFTTSEGITIVDRAGNSTVLSTSDSTAGLAWDPSGDAIWTARQMPAGTSTGLWRVALDGKLREVARLPGDVMIHDVSSDGRLLIHHGFTTLGARAKAPGEAGEHDVAVFDDNGDIAITADGSRLLLYDQTEPSLGWALLRPTRGGPAIRVAAGWPLGLSPDGKWVLVRRDEENVAKVVLVPTGPGEQRVVPTEGLRNVGNAWFLDATHVLLNGSVEGKPWRTFLLDLEGGKPVPVTPEKTFAVPRSVADGSVIGLGPEGALARYPLGGGQPRQLAVRFPFETSAIGASADGRFLFLGEGGVPGHIDRFDLATGRRTAWKTLQPDDPAGFAGVGGFDVTPDGAAYAYRYLRFLQKLYVVEGLR